MSAQLTRRHVMAIASGLLASAGAAQALPVLGRERVMRQTPRAEGALLPPGEGTTVYPLTLETPFGTTVLEQRPERIAITTAATFDTDAMFALGAVPVFAPSTIERNLGWITQEEIDSIESRWESEAGAEVSAESVAASKPDLIVTLWAYDTFDQTRFDQLSTIAPVLYDGSSLSWQEITIKLGEALDLKQTAEDLVAEIEAAFVEAREIHPEFAGKTASYIHVYSQEYGVRYASAAGSDSAYLLELLGFTLPEAAAQFADDTTISDELYGLIDADFVLITAGEGEYSDYFFDSALYQAVPAVVDGRVAIYWGTEDAPNFAWALNVQSARSVPWLLATIVELAESVIS